MPALVEGKLAPEFSLPFLHGEVFSLQDALTRGPVVAAFFKISCPVCQFALPFLERISKSQGGQKVTFIGVSQNDAKDTSTFVKHFGITFPMLLDDTNSYPVSNAYGLTNVPTTFWIGQDGTIEISSVGWSRREIEEIHRKAADTHGHELGPLFQAEESVPEFRAG